MIEERCADRDEERAVMNRLWRDGVARGERMADFVERELGRPLRDMDVLEIGVGGGGIARVFASRAKSLVGGDCDTNFLDEVRSRPDYQAAPFPLKMVDAVDLPFQDESFDLVLLNGVLEFVGCREGSLSPWECQRKALEEIRRVLKPGGCLYLGIENRLCPHYLFHDPHTQQPLVNFLPRRLANWYSRRRDGTPYRNWIYSRFGLRRLLRKAGYWQTKLFLPVNTYQFPLYYARGSREMLRFLWRKKQPARDDFERVCSISWRGRLWFSFLALFGLQSLFMNTFVVLCTNRGGTD